MLRPGIYIQSCSIGRNVISTGDEVTVDYGSDYCKSNMQYTTGLTCQSDRATLNGEFPKSNGPIVTVVYAGRDSTTQVHRPPGLALNLWRISRPTLLLWSTQIDGESSQRNVSATARLCHRISSTNLQVIPLRRRGAFTEISTSLPSTVPVLNTT